MVEKYIRIKTDDILLNDLLVLTAPNGFGKTYAVAGAVAKLSSMKIFDRIYFLANSQDACGSIVQKLRHHNAKLVIWYEGIERSCMNKELLEVVEHLTGDPSLACLVCPYSILQQSKNREITPETLVRRVLKFFEERDVAVIRARDVKMYLLPNQEICGHSVIRALTLRPSLDFKIYLERLNVTPIFVAPFQLFLTYSTAQVFMKSAERLRKERRYLFVFDEADNLLLMGKVYTIEKPDFTDFDYEILNKLSPSTYRLSAFIDIYTKLFNIIAEGRKELSRYDSRIGVSDIKRQVHELLSSRTVERVVAGVCKRLRTILLEALKQMKRTFLFRAVESLNPFTLRLLKSYGVQEFVKYIDCDVVRRRKGSQVEEEVTAIRLQNFSIVSDMVFSNEKPIRKSQKVVVTATWCDDLMRRLFKVGAECVRVVRAVPDNVYFGRFVIYETGSRALESTVYGKGQFTYRVLYLIKKVIDVYAEKFGMKPSGVLVWFMSKRQFRAFLSVLREKRAKISIESDDLASITVAKVKVLLTYLGSRITRGVDLPDYDISIVLAPFLRPPRSFGARWLDCDYARAIFESIQAVMRIVRSPSPSRPKVVMLEDSLFKSPYKDYAPAWFVDFIKSGRKFIELDLVTAVSI
ncbi:MAG: hypothetical protein DRJ40_08275 [Thermoprotei archaeon]|nr:MAG: hypothetical protein DRJ40_08275 [Thermoprotei archaeon]